MRPSLEARLRALPGLTVAPWKDSDLICLLYQGREFAHFQTEAEDVIDIQLTPQIIREEGLDRTVSAQFHPKRSKNSRWICVRFADAAGVERVLHLVKRACEETL